MEKVPKQQTSFESYLFSQNLKIFENDDKDITLFKYHFVDDSSKKLLRANRLKKIEETRNNIPKTSTNDDQVSLSYLYYHFPNYTLNSALIALVKCFLDC